MNPKAENRIAMRRRQSVGRAEQIACQAAGEDAWTSSLLGTGQKCFKARCASKHSAKSFPPSPFTANGRRGGRRAAEAASCARRRLLPAGQEKPREAAPVPLHCERAARRTKGSRSGTPREKETSPGGAGKAERGGTRPPSPRTGGEADEGQPKRRRAAWRRERTQHARTHNVCMSGIKDFGSNREVAFERWDYEKEP